MIDIIRKIPNDFRNHKTLCKLSTDGDNFASAQDLT